MKKLMRLFAGIAVVLVFVNCITFPNITDGIRGKAGSSTSESYVLIYIDNYPAIPAYEGMYLHITPESSPISAGSYAGYSDVFSNAIAFEATPEGYQCLMDTVAALGLTPFQPLQQ